MPALLSAANKPLVCCPVRYSRPALNLAIAVCLVALLRFRGVVEEHFLSKDAAYATYLRKVRWRRRRARRAAATEPRLPGWVYSLTTRVRKAHAEELLEENPDCRQ